MKRYSVTFLATLLTLFLTAGVVAGEKIKIGAIFSVTGGQASLDIPGLRGAQRGRELHVPHCLWR